MEALGGVVDGNRVTLRLPDGLPFGRLCMVRWKFDIQFGFPFGELREGPLLFLTYRHSHSITHRDCISALGKVGCGRRQQREGEGIVRLVQRNSPSIVAVSRSY